MKHLLLAVAAAALAACSPDKSADAADAPTAAPPRVMSPESWVASFYVKEPDWNTPEQMRALFEPTLAEAIIKDTGNPGEVGAIDFSFTCGCQDGLVTEVTTAATQTAEGALVTARFKLEGAPTRIDYRLIHAAGGWKIADVSAPTQNGFDGWSLRKLVGLDK